MDSFRNDKLYSMIPDGSESKLADGTHLYYAKFPDGNGMYKLPENGGTETRIR